MLLINSSNLRLDTAKKKKKGHDYFPLISRLVRLELRHDNERTLEKVRPLNGRDLGAMVW